MALIQCPECKKSISSFAKNCPECGFPIEEFLTNNNINNFSKLFVCPKCADYYYGHRSEYDAIPLKCDYCKTTLVQTDVESLEFMRKGALKAYEDETNRKLISLAKQYGNNQFSQEAYDDRSLKLKRELAEWDIKHKQEKQQSLQPQIHCPTCNSTNIVKISASRKIAGAIGFGIFSKTAKSQFECKSCGYKF